MQRALQLQLQRQQARPPRPVAPCGPPAPPRARQPRSRRQSIVPSARRDAAPDPGPAPDVPEESDFDKETARLALRMLTARAAGIVLANVAQVDQFKASWLQEHFKQNPPIEGNDFLSTLLEAKPVYSVDPYSGARHHINPAQIASAVLATREALAQKLARSLGPRVQSANMELMRSHLETHTYVSGSNDATKPSFRHYRNHSSMRPHQRLK